MNLLEWGNEMKKRVEKMNANRPKDALVMANDLNALVWLRIQTTGKAYTGSSFSPYSPGYKKTKSKAGHQTSYVDFTRTGELARNIRPEVIASSSDSVTIEITARDSRNQAKLRGAVSQPKGAPRGNPLIPNEREIGIIRKANLDRGLKYLTNA